MNQSKRKRWTSEEDSQLAGYLAKNLRAEKIAKLMNRTTSAIYTRTKVVKDIDVKEPSPNLRNDYSGWNEHQISMLRSMVAKGKNAKEIAEALGRTTHAIYSRKWKIGMNDRRITRSPKSQKEPVTVVPEVRAQSVIKTGANPASSLSGVFINNVNLNEEIERIAKELSEKTGKKVSLAAYLGEE